MSADRAASSVVPQTMRAMVLTGYGGLDKLAFRSDWPVPQPSPDEVLIRVGACGTNNTDINTRTGWYSKSVTEGTTAGDGSAGDGSAGDGAGGSDSGGTTENAASWGFGDLRFPHIQGADVCGEVVAAGVGGRLSKEAAALVGRRVLVDTWLRDWDDPLNLDKCGYFGSERPGGFAEYTTAPVRNVHPIDSPLRDVDLATFATPSITAENMLTRARVEAGDVVLIPGASGGVGSALVQLVRRRGGVPVAMCGPDKAAAVAAIGAKAVLPRQPEDLAGALQAAIGRPTVDVVTDVVGGPVWPDLMDVLRRGGRYSCSGAIAGPIVSFDLRTFYLKDLTLTGATIVPPGLFADLVGYIARGEIKPLLAGTYPLERLHDAQEAFLAKRHVGNIVIDMAAR